MSGTDQRTQTDFQSMFPDAIALVMNPFGKNGIDYKFFRYDENGRMKNINYDFIVEGSNE